MPSNGSNGYAACLRPCRQATLVYHHLMSAAPAFEVFAESLAHVESCLNRDSAKALLDLPPNPRLQARVDELADKCNEEDLTLGERSEYEALIWADHFLALLHARARHFLAVHPLV